VPSLVTMQYNAAIPSTWEWQAGVQKSLPAGMVLDVSYVGDHAYNQYGGTQGGNQVGQNQVPSARPFWRSIRIRRSALRPFRARRLSRPICSGRSPALARSRRMPTQFHNSYHSLQVSVNRRFSHGFSVAANYTYGISATGNTGLTQRWAETSPGVLVLRSDEAAYEALK